MKNVVFIAVIFIVSSFTTNTFKITDEERAFALKELSNSKQQLLQSVDGLSDTQLNFKSTTESWSIAECIEHLTISEHTFYDMLQGLLQNPVDETKEEAVAMTDEQLLTLIRDRSNRVKTSEAFEPSGKYGTYMETLEALKGKRKEHMEYMRTTEDDLRNYYGQLPFGTIDAYQLILFMSGHMDRHVAQIDEIMADEDFPE